MAWDAGQVAGDGISESLRVGLGISPFFVAKSRTGLDRADRPVMPRTQTIRQNRTTSEEI